MDYHYQVKGVFSQNEITTCCKCGIILGITAKYLYVHKDNQQFHYCPDCGSDYLDKRIVHDKDLAMKMLRFATQEIPKIKGVLTSQKGYQDAKKIKR